ncbi:C40 family peptidase [Sporosarcina highlanderae]|uniref:C40 family peptidase n=1 Tax=Sporosarcina highlanderae TaxID=3035916 RepID=A0ABT8JND7_9BACL|nr:C40 family peptidase [Sporosarcina highlanderae]MDN4606665.1 C40 family peptidase [Sporosarcina highlanderae]
MTELTVNMYACAVPVATVWTSPESAREMDEEGIANPLHLNKWLEKLAYEERLDLCNSNRVQTQILYGEPVIVEKIVGEWARIIAVWQPSKKDERGYPGWVPLTQLKKATPLEEAGGFIRVAIPKSQLWKSDSTPFMIVPFNTILPLTDESEDHFHVMTPDGEALVLKTDIVEAPSIHQFKKRPPESAVDEGLVYLDLPYFWGGMSSYGFDCSGFTYNMMKACGYFIPRDASDQAKSGEEVPKGDPSCWKKGDLIFFANDEGKGNVRHVGFYYGNGLLLHSPSTGQSVELVKLEGSKLERDISAVRRFGAEEGSS